MLSASILITWPWPPVGRFSHALITLRQKEMSIYSCQTYARLSCLHFAQYILICQHGINCKQTWSKKINCMIFNYFTGLKSIVDNANYTHYIITANEFIIRLLYQYWLVNLPKGPTGMIQISRLLLSLVWYDTWQHDIQSQIAIDYFVNNNNIEQQQPMDIVST